MRHSSFSGEKKRNIMERDSESKHLQRFLMLILKIYRKKRVENNFALSRLFQYNILHVEEEMLGTIKEIPTNPYVELSHRQNCSSNYALSFWLICLTAETFFAGCKTVEVTIPAAAKWWNDIVLPQSDIDDRVRVVSNQSCSR